MYGVEKKKSKVQPGNQLNEYTNSVANRLADGQSKGMFDETSQVRDDEGIILTFSRIIDMAGNMYLQDPQGSCDPAKAVINFSNGNSMGSNLGVSGGNIQTMDAIDISIAAAVFSLMPYLCVERDMSASSTSISYQDIVAEFANGNIAAGETVLGTFLPPNSNVNLSLPTKLVEVDSGATVADHVASFVTPLMPGTLAIVVLDQAGTPVVLSTGFDRNGVIYMTGSVNFSATVNYKEGTVTMLQVPVTLTVRLVANIDSSSDSTGTTILTVTPELRHTILTAYPQQLILKDNAFKNAFLNKLSIKLAGTNAAIDYGSIAVGKLISIYINYINRITVTETLTAGEQSAALAISAGTNVTQDISGYIGGGGADGFADTKNDLIKGMIISLNQKILDLTGRGMTCILTSSRGVNKLANTPDFIKSADYNELNAMVGTYDGTPVLRHQDVQRFEPIDGKSANFYGLYKDPSGACAPTAFGEFLPVQTTAPVANYNNPSQIAQALTSYAGVCILVAPLCQRATLKFLA